MKIKKKISCFLIAFSVFGTIASSCAQTNSNIVEFNGVNNDVTLLSDALDNIESLAELTSTDLNDGNKKKKLQRNLEGRDLDNSEEYTDYTVPEESYYQHHPAYPYAGSTYYVEFNKFFLTMDNFYNLAKERKDMILGSDNFKFLNVWYDDDGLKNRVTYDEESNDLICESIADYYVGYSYAKLNIGINENGKLYYSYLYAEFNKEMPLYDGLKYQATIEYLEDSYYKSYELTGTLNENENVEDYIPHYQYKKYCYEVDLSIEGGFFCNWYTSDCYDTILHKRFDVDENRYLEEDEYPLGKMWPINCFWKEGSYIVGYRFLNDFMGVSLVTEYGQDALDIFYYENTYDIIMNLYEVDGVKKVLGKASLDRDYVVEFENGKVIRYDDEIKTIPWGWYSSDYGACIYPCVQMLDLNSYQELKELLQEYGIITDKYDLEKLFDLFEVPKLLFNELELTYKNAQEISEYFNSKIAMINFEEAKKDYENVEEIKIPVDVYISIETEGEANVIEDTIDLSKVRLLISNFDGDEKDLNKIDLYIDGVKVCKLDFQYEDGVITFVNVEKVKLEKNKYNNLGDFKMYIKFSNLGIKIEIPYEY